MSYTLVFDTETTGLWANTLRTLDKQPKVIEFFGLKLDEETGETLSEYEALINVNEKLDPKITKITSITDDMLKDAKTFEQLAKDIKEVIEGAEVVVAHNLMFDIQMMNFEFARLGQEIKWPEKKICTVERTEHIHGFRLNLSSLHEYLFGEKFDGAHRAAVDVRALAKCYLELRKRGEI